MGSNGHTSRQVEQAALTYASYGFEVVILHDSGTAKGKAPRLPDWPAKATADEELLAELLASYPNCNIGLRLGPGSGLIDIEYDSEEGKRTAERLFTGCVTPTYTSRRSTHRLFRYTDQLPAKPWLKAEGLEIRIGAGGGAQSVAPPSRHPDGTLYQWVDGLSIYEVDPAEVPPQVMELIRAAELAPTQAPSSAAAVSAAKDRATLLQGVPEGGRNNALASLIGGWLSRLSDSEFEDPDTLSDVLIKAHGQNALNQPPLPITEVETVYRSILKRETQRRAARELERFAHLPPDDVIPSAAPTEGDTTSTASESPEGSPGAPQSGLCLSLTIVEGEPSIFVLRSPLFRRREGSEIELTAAQLQSFKAFQNCALDQAWVHIDSAYSKRWPAILAQLIANAERRAPDPETHRPSIIAAVILEQATGTYAMTEAEIREQGVRGFNGVSAVEGGKVAISATKLRSWVKSESILDNCTDKEIIRILRAAGATQKRGRTRWWEVSLDALDAIEKQGRDLESIGQEARKAQAELQAQAELAAADRGRQEAREFPASSEPF